MLSIKNLSKKYKIKGSNDVLALDNVSIDFPDNGLVFILGKSGSGKSTLLNLIGGLEKPTSGEIIINGKSTSLFSNKDFDFYRNTYIGFIFQEYNLINDSSIIDNISVSLQLQGKQPSDNEIKEVLKLVDLEDLENRLPEELSGGQKQRIAIARALIKNPNIVLADEPSGSLDSENGKQIFEVLKKLSNDRLIIVVSHDEDFANKYADRIINLKDGKIVKDITKNKIESTKNNEKRNELVKSKLPTKVAFKMGLHNLKLNPIRLSVTILLSVIAFTIFGLFSTLIFYNPAYSYSDAIKKENYSSVRLEKKYRYNSNLYRLDNTTGDLKHDSSREESATCGISVDDLNSLNKNSVGLNFAGIYNNDGKGYSYASFINKRSNNEFYFYNNFSGLCDCGEDFLLNEGFERIAGHYPQNFNEIAVSTYALELFNDGGFKSVDGTEKEINNAEDLLNCEIELPLINEYYSSPLIKLTICGIYDVGTEYEDQEFDLLKKYNIDTSNNYSYKEVSEKFQNAFTSCFFSLGFVSEDFYDTYSSYLTPSVSTSSRIDYTQLSGIHFISPSQMDTYNASKDNDYYYNSAWLENCCFFEDVIGNTNDIVFVDAFGNQIEDTVKLDNEGIYANIFCDPFESIVESIANYIESRNVTYYDREGNIYFNNEQKNLIRTDLYIDYNDLSLSFEASPEKSLIEGVILDDSGNVSCYCRTVYFDEDHSNYAFDSNSQYKDKEMVWFKNDGTLINEITEVSLRDFYYDSINKKIYLKDDVVYSEDERGYVLKEDNATKVERFFDYCVDKDGYPYEPSDRTNTYVGLFVNPENGEVSLTKKDGWIFTDEYYYDVNGNIYFGQLIFYGTYVMKNGIKTNYLTYDGHPLGHTSFYRTNNSANYYVESHPEVAKSIIKYSNIGGHFTYNDYIFDDYNFAAVGTEFTWSDLKLILDTYNVLKAKEDFESAISGDYKVFGVTTTDRTFLNVELKGFFIPYYCSTTADYILDKNWTNKAVSSSKEKYSWIEKKETKYIESKNLRYNYVICNTKKTQKEFAFLIQEYSDDTFYKIQNALFLQIDNVVRGTGMLKAVFFIAGDITACLSIFLFANFISNSISVKAKDIGVLRANGARGIDIFKIFLCESGVLCLGCIVLSIILSSVCSIALNNGIAKGIKISIINFGIVNVGIVFGIAILACFLGMFLPILKISKKTPNQLIKNI